MKKGQFNSDGEANINKILKYQEKELDDINNLNKVTLEETISKSENILKEMGYQLNDKTRNLKRKKTIIVPTWEEMCKEATETINEDISIQDLFTDEELELNEIAIENLNNEFKSLYKLDNTEIAISVFAGLLSAVIDILLIGIPQRTSKGIEAGKLSNYVRNWFEREFPEINMEKLANSKISKVPYDAQDNRNTPVRVEGLSAYYHRLLTIGHDPFLGLLFGVCDILNGTMTSIDKNGKIVSQVINTYSDRKEKGIFSAITKQIIHFKSDITTSMGLPAPYMSVFNLFQFGDIGKEDQTIAEIVQGMYYEGYDFIHFCSSSIPTMLIEVIVRIGYSLKKLSEGTDLKDSIPFSLNRSKNPKLITMLFISHSIACAVNSGKIYFEKNPLAINYPEWLTFAKYSYKQLKWALIQKTQLKDAYINNTLSENMQLIYGEINTIYHDFEDKYNIILK